MNEPEPRCIHCGRPADWWKSWNEAGEWVCDECWPDPDWDDEDGAA